MRNQYTIAITGLNATDNPGPGVPVARSLQEAQNFDCRIIGLCYDPMEPGVYIEGLVERSYLIPYPAAGTQALLARIKEIQDKEHIDVIIPNFDAELYSFIKIKDELEQIGIKMCLPTIEQLEDRQKYNLPNFSKKHDIKVPNTTIYKKQEELTKKTRSYPTVVKGKYYEAYVVKNEEEFQNKSMMLIAKWGYPVICQELVNGTEYNVVGCGDGEGNCIACVAMRKQFITDKGKAWSGISIKNNEMQDLCKKFVKETHWKGGFELELMQSKDKELYLIEINPRLPAWVYLATSTGQNIPEQLVMMAKGEQPQTYDTYEAGKMFVRCSWDLITDQSEFANFSVNTTYSLQDKHNE